jgi:hypothetical protein
MKFFFLIRLLVFTCLISISCFGQRRSRGNTVPCTDPATFVILPFSKYVPEYRDIPLKDSCMPTNLDSSEIAVLQTLIINAVEEHNQETKDMPYSFINLGNRYKMQFVPVVNSKGEKIVWVNCFCRFWDDFCNTWRTQAVIVDDGGTCYFNFKINLSAKKWFDFVVNGVA